MSEFFGIPIAQNEKQIGWIIQHIVKNDAALFVELGVYLGGLMNIMIFLKAVLPNFDYLGIDFNKDQVDNSMCCKPEFIHKSVFSEEAVKLVSDRISSAQGCAIVYCDDGDKPREVLTYAPLLRPGDIVLAHDYPGEMPGGFADQFNAVHPDFTELDADKRDIRGLLAWRKI